MSKVGVHPAVARGVQRALLGGSSRSGFGSDVLAYVDAVGDLAGRLAGRGWIDVSSGPDLAWDWPGTVLPEQMWDGTGSSGPVLPCTSIRVAADDDEASTFVVEVTLVGQPDTVDVGHLVAPADLTEPVLAELEAYQPGQPSPLPPAR